MISKVQGDIIPFYVMDNCVHTESIGFTGLCAECEDLAHSTLHSVFDPNCFACKVQTVGLQFTYGKKDFHGPTIGERQSEQYRICKEDGVDIAPVQKTWS